MTVAAAHSGQGAEGRGRIVTVFGGTGFLGRRVVGHLLDRGFGVRVAARHLQRTPPVSGLNEVSADSVRADVHDEASVAAALVNAYAAVNAVSLYLERGGHQTFHAVHVEAAARIARLAREAGVERLLHVSGIGADPASPSDYVRARGEGEIVVSEAFRGATLVRPSLMFAADDHFLMTLVRLLRTLPVYPLFGRGGTRLQPVHADDVAEGIARILSTPGAGHRDYEFGGPRSYTYTELLRSIADQLGVRPRLLPFPFALWQAVAFVSEFAPGAPLTRSQVALMRRDNVASGKLPGLRDLHIAPMALEDVLATFADSSDAVRTGKFAQALRLSVMQRRPN